jgi:GntR family transcriptional regulator/MocR family aminotransferase
MTAPLAIQLDLQSKEPLQLQIEMQLRAQIKDGILRSGSRLPSSRVLASDIGVARGTVSTVYVQLIAEGLLEGRRGAGTFVALDEKVRLATAPPASRGERDYTSWSNKILLQSAPSLHVMPGRRFTYDFRLGKPDAAAFPTRQWQRLLIQHVASVGRTMSDYTDPAGHPALREALCRAILPRRGVRCDPDDIVIVGGTQDGVNLLGRLFRVSGQSVAIENPCYEGAALALLSLGAKLCPVPVDAAGACSDALSASSARLVYVTPSHQFPLGITMTMERRRALIAWAEANDGVIIEDDYDSDVQYAPAISAIKALAPERVIYIGSFSKSIGPGIRIGYLVLPPRLARAARAMKSIMSNGQPWLEQAVLAEFISTGAFERHLGRIKRHYMRRRDALVEALKRIAPGSAFNGINGGMHLAWRLPEHLPEAETVREACARESIGLYSLSGSPCFTTRFANEQLNVLFCGYSALTPHLIAQATARMGLVLEKLKSVEISRRR